MIKLGYIEGYNSYNEIKFNNTNDRDAHFNGWVDYTIDAYYPPYYTNVIKLDKSEVPQTAPINFVILVYNNKYYYYFVDHFNYINEDIYEIVINMDTVLTHMFDFVVKQGLITRKSIARWIYEDNVYKINRNYVRENVSEGIMEVSSFEYRNPNKYVIITSSKNWADSNEKPCWYIKDNTYFNVGYYVYLFPLPPYPLPLSGTIDIFVDDGRTRLGVVNYANFINEFISDPYTINIMYAESEYLDNIFNPRWINYLPYQQLVLWLKPAMTLSSFVKIDGLNTWGFNVASLEIDNNQVFTDNYGFTRNTTFLERFNYLYIPQLLDENYIQVEYGDVNGFSSYPLHQSKTDTFNYYNNLDITNGNSGYYILDDLTSDNKYNTYNISLGLTFDLITDPWKEYQAQNKGTLSTGLQLQAVNTLYSTAKSVIPMANGVSFTNTNRLYQNLEKNTESFTNKETTSFNKGGMTGVSDGLMQGINIIANYQINRDNLEFSPDTVKGRADIYSMLFSNYKKPYLKKYMVNDIVNCARKLEEFGYRVNEVFNGNSYLHNIVNIRTFYNCLSMRVKLYTTVCFIPNDIINDILARLENGLRFIDIHSIPTDLSITDIFNYDNVER